MTPGDASQLMIALGQLIVAGIALASYVQSRRNASKIEEIHKATNSMKDALVKSTGDESFARGVRAGEASSMNINHRQDREPL